jgi:L-threonylcarbamoyladenylate synthase
MIYYFKLKSRTQMRNFSRDEAIEDQIESAVRTLKNGGVVAIPTDTLYGLAACAFNVAAVERVFHLKGRPAGMALPLLLADADDVLKCAVDVPEVAWELVERFWPGALTLVMKKASSVPDIVTAGMNTVALRVPDHHIPRTIARKLGAPITGTSANRSGSPGLTTAQVVRDEFGSALDLIVDGGETQGGVASTVLDMTGKRPRILRQGAVLQDEIEAMLDDTIEVV